MQDPIFWMTLSGAGLIGLAVIAFAALSGWRGWLELERMRIEARGETRGHQGGPGNSPSPAARIELADLKERIRKLEAIAAGVDL